jgi:hypothetical protein
MKKIEGLCVQVINFFKKFLRFDKFLNFEQCVIVMTNVFEMGGFVAIECENLSIYVYFVS